MKKISVILVSIALIFAFSSAANPHKEGKERTNNPGPPPGITYVVSVYAPAGIQFCGEYYVTIRNEFGFPVGAQIQYQPGISDYVFREMGPVSGIRTAVLTRNLSPASTCLHSLYTVPVSVKTNFRNGTTYLFNLFPSAQSAYN